MKENTPAKDPFFSLPMTVGLAIGVLLLIKFCIPNFVRSGPGPTAGCISNLRQIDSAKQTWAMETRAPSNAIPTWENVKPYMGRGAGGSLLKCPQGGVYTLGNLQTAPSCSIKGHTME